MEQATSSVKKTCRHGAGLLISIALVLSSSIFSWSFYQTRVSSDTITVTGSAKVAVKSDSGKWVGSFSRTVSVNDLQSGYSKIAEDLKVVKKYLSDNGVDEKNVIVSPVFMNQDYNYNPDRSIPQNYNLVQNIEVNLDDIDKITALARNSDQLINNNIIFSAQAPEYYFTKLPETRISLLGDAVKDARARAEKIAESGGKNVTNLKEAGVGVTQVMSKNSIDVSDYGTYDTSKIEKEVTITVKATFNLK